MSAIAQTNRAPFNVPDTTAPTPVNKSATSITVRMVFATNDLNSSLSI